MIEVDVGHGDVLEMSELRRLPIIMRGRRGGGRSCIAIVAEVEEVPGAFVCFDGVYAYCCMFHWWT